MTAAERINIRVATLTLSDTRVSGDDESGRVLGVLLAEAGFEVVSHAIVREEPELLRAAVEHFFDADAADALVLTGGTGIAPRDRTIETVAPLFEKTVDGFGETFRRLSWEKIGARAILSRAMMGVARGRVIVALPGSPSAVRLAVAQLLAPTLAHAVGLASGRATQHGHDHHTHRT